MRRVSVDIGGTFTDCYVAWDDRHVETKALTTHHNLAVGFNEALDYACQELGLNRHGVLSQIDSVRYATTLGTNALIERKGPKIGLLMTGGFKSTIPLSRGRGYGEGLDIGQQMDIPNADRPDAIIPIPLIQIVRERVDYKGQVLMRLDETDVRSRLRDLVDAGVEAIVVSLTNSVANPVHEMRIQEIFLEEYPGHLLGAIPLLLGHQVAGRKGEYGRTMSTILDSFLHQVMYHGLGSLELNLREYGYTKPMLVVHNSGGMAQLNSTDALQTIHSGPVSGIAAAEHLAGEADLGNVVATDMGGTSFDIGMVVKGGVKFYDFNPVIERWLVSIPMVHLLTLGAGGGSIAKYDKMFKTLKLGPESAGSDPGPVCYDRGGLRPTVTDADLLLGYLDPDNYAGGHIKLNPRRAKMVIEEELCDDLDLDLIDTCKLIKTTVDHDMANGIATELRARGFEPSEFVVLAYGGNGPLHACGIADALGVTRFLSPPFSSVFSACGAGNLDQAHIHEQSIYMSLFDSNKQQMFDNYAWFNDIVADLERRGRDDLLRQGMAEEDIHFRVELDMRYGNQRAETAVVVPLHRMGSIHDVLAIIDLFHKSYGERFGEGSQVPEAGIRVNTIRVRSFVEHKKIAFRMIKPAGEHHAPPAPVGQRTCHFVSRDEPAAAPIYDERALERGTRIIGPAIVTTRSTTYLIEPGWRFDAAGQGAVWFTRHNS